MTDPSTLKQLALDVINAFAVPRRLSWVIKGINNQGIIPVSETQLKLALYDLEQEGDISVSTSNLGNPEYYRGTTNDL